MARFMPLCAAGKGVWHAYTRTQYQSAVRQIAAQPTLCLNLVRGYATDKKKGKGSQPSSETDIRKVRNIGIIAHIDAGKTTTTERMLFYSGYTKRIGNVDEGDTVMDYLPAERNRGITITSAAISFDWNSHRVNLIDTPGHADFTFEVIRSIRVLDGAVTVLDGVEGVEAQTEKVWHQAKSMGIPRIIFVNKMDREGAGFGRTVREVAGKLQAKTAVINMPMFRAEIVDGMTVARSCGIIDVIEMKAIEWAPNTDGREFKVLELTGEHLEEATKARVALVETLAELDDDMIEKFLEADDDHMAIASADIKKALRRCTLANKLVPVLSGASFRNIGVQPLLDAVIDYLPSPADRPSPIMKSTDPKIPDVPLAKAGTGSALAFKVIHDGHTGKILVFVRVYSGTLITHSKIFNTSNRTEERALQLSRMYADSSVRIDSIPEGHIGVISGTKEVRTGDTIIFSSKGQGPSIPQNQLRSMQLLPIDIPSPVFFASIEPRTASDQKPLDDGLATLLREDPSLQLSVDDETGQTQLSGMGELHLEISRDRLINDLKVNAHVGKIQIAYKESVDPRYVQSTPARYEYSRVLKAGSVSAAATVSIRGIPDDLEFADDSLKAELARSTQLPENNYLTLPEGYELSHSKIDIKDLRTALQNGVSSGLFHGKKYGLPVHSVLVSVSDIELPLDLDSAAPLAQALRFAISAVMDSVPEESRNLMEPVMDVTVIVDDEDIGSVMSDISSARSGRVYALEDESASRPTQDDTEYIDPNLVYSPPDTTLHLSKHNLRRTLDKKLIKAKVPLNEMVGYLKFLRSMTQGRGSFVMAFDRYERASKDRTESIWAKQYE
ncbi:ribosome-releasing factor 2, mitochondrial [Myxozyma melibiosi]|uniref:Ribosome-releasing factor 2, mitochondrial n=1 Tax=Myxozyma melibiosi TaxID=54550 RepID=A0ABR1FBP7_9ASCO